MTTITEESFEWMPLPSGARYTHAWTTDLQGRPQRVRVSERPGGGRTVVTVLGADDVPAVKGEAGWSTWPTLAAAIQCEGLRP